MTSASEVLAALIERGWTFAIAESLTGGALAAEFVSVPGASASLRGAIVAYATPVKHTLLGVDDGLLDAHGPVHRGVALQMAAGARRAMEISGVPADVGVSTTGIAGPDSPDGQPVGTVHIAVVTPDRSVSEVFRFDGDRARVRAQAVDAAVEMLARVVRE
ncbi:CinA family protein [Microbacterium sp. WCS2018Hpa-9]|uniref:CinA family protein n=1 Tax=Microbacterium sp. WCS2018Hpa-9 TaxID=3073635 RepID=UPI002889E136|nr:CinA family protein [Microbacterium sp. WCS2018Hpa-9]